MVIAFANNQEMTAMQGANSVIYTDPVPLNGNDRATCILNVHNVWAQGASSTIAYQGEVSLDGETWADASSLAENRSSIGSELLPNIGVYGAFIRFRFTLTVVGTGVLLGGVNFDLHVLLDKS